MGFYFLLYSDLIFPWELASNFFENASKQINLQHIGWNKMWGPHRPCCVPQRTRKCFHDSVLALLPLYQFCGEACRLRVCVCGVYLSVCLSWQLGGILSRADSHWHNQETQLGFSVFTKGYDFIIRLLIFWNEKIQPPSVILAVPASADRGQGKVNIYRYRNGHTHHLSQVGLGFYPGIKLYQ